MDTGSDLSLIKENTLDVNTEKINKNNTRTMLGIGNKPVDTLGEITLEIRIGNGILKHNFHLVPNTFPVDADGVLGNDFLTINKAIINYKTNKLIIQNNAINLLCSKIYKGCKSMIIVPPRTEMVIPVQVVSDLKEGLIEGKTIIDGLYCPSALVRADNLNIGYTTVLNTTENEIILKNMKARLKPIEINNQYSAGYEKEEVTDNSQKKQRFHKILKLLRLEHLNEEEKDSVITIFKNFEDIFHLEHDLLTATNIVQHEIHTNTNAPITSKLYRYPHFFKEIVSNEINDLLKQDIIRPSNSAWNSPVWVVPKKTDSTGEKKYRLVIDYRKLNEQTIGDAYPIPNISDILDQLGHSKYFTTLDLASGYHQINMHPRDTEKTAFSVPLGHYEFNRMPFGLKNAPSTFQRLMNTVLSGLQGTRCLVYLDDIVIFADSLENHNKKLIEIFTRLKEYNLKLKPSKCEFLRKEVIYLGHKISETGAQPDESKLDAVRSFPRPKTARDIKSFLGLAGYYRRFIQDFSKKALPLTSLLKKDASFQWTDQQEQAFGILKDCLTEQPILQFPDFERPFNVTTDASNFAIGAVLSQGDYPKDLPVAYASRCLNSAEINYSVIEKELLAIVWAVRHFRPYLYGRRFRIVTDHQPLTWLFNIKDPKSRLVRWRLELEEYDYAIIYKPGRVNSNADALSRNPIVSNDSQSQVKSEDNIENCNIGILSSNKVMNNQNKTKWNNKNKKIKEKGSNQISCSKTTVSKNKNVDNKMKCEKMNENKSIIENANDINHTENYSRSILKKSKNPRKKKEIKLKCYEDFVESSTNVLKIYQNTNVQEVNIPIKDFKDNLVLRFTKNMESANKVTNEICKENYHNLLIKQHLLKTGNLETGSTFKCEIGTKNVIYLILTDTLVDPLIEKDLYHGLENLKILCLKENLHEFTIVNEDFKEIGLDRLKNMLKYVFEGTNINIVIITETKPLRVNISLSFRKFRSYNQRNVVENDEYREHHTMIFDTEGPIVCHLPLNLEQPNGLLTKYDLKFNHLNELRKDIDDNKIKVGDIVEKRHKDKNIYYLFYKENDWDNFEYDQMYDCYEILKNKLLRNKETKINIPVIEFQYNKINWDKIRVMLKYVFKNSKIFVHVFKNLIINPSKDEILKIVKEYHSNVTSGHSGISKTCARIKEKYYWPTLKRDVEKFIKHCDSCQRYKLVRKKNIQPMEITTTSKQSFNKIFLDIVGPLHDTDCHNKFILTLQDDLSKYSQAYPIKDHTAETIAEVLVRQFICKFGNPNIIVTDQGTEFMSELFTNVAKLFKIRKYYATAYHPQSNGALERSHQGLLDYIKQYTNQYKETWDNWLDFAMLSYNTTPHTVTQYPPYELVFGRKPNLPTFHTSTNEPIYTYEDYLTELKLKLSHAFDTAHNHILSYKERNKNYYDKHARPETYKVGDQVLLQKETFLADKSKKLQPRYEGPYEIIEIDNPNCTLRYKRNKNLKVHFNRIKHYIS